MATQAEIKAEARRMSTTDLASKRVTASNDCALHNVRLATLRATPHLYVQEIAATERAMTEACNWAGIADEELSRRAAAKVGAPSAAPRKQATSKPPTPPADVGQVVAPTVADEPGSVWPWLAGAAALGLGVLTVIGARQPKVVRYVKALPKKAKRAVGR